MVPGQNDILANSCINRLRADRRSQLKTAVRQDGYTRRRLCSSRDWQPLQKELHRCDHPKSTIHSQEGSRGVGRSVCWHSAQWHAVRERFGTCLWTIGCTMKSSSSGSKIHRCRAVDCRWRQARMERAHLKEDMTVKGNDHN